eukprot:568985_1
MEEHEAAQKIEKESARINEAIVNTANIMEKLNENSKTASKTINNTFDQIVENANKRRDFLLARLKQITSHKSNQLSAQKEEFSQLRYLLWFYSFDNVLLDSWERCVSEY